MTCFTNKIFLWSRFGKHDITPIESIFFFNSWKYVVLIQQTNMKYKQYIKFFQMFILMEDVYICVLAYLYMNPLFKFLQFIHTKSFLRHSYCFWIEKVGNIIGSSNIKSLILWILSEYIMLDWSFRHRCFLTCSSQTIKTLVRCFLSFVNNFNRVIILFLIDL